MKQTKGLIIALVIIIVLLGLAKFRLKRDTEGRRGESSSRGQPTIPITAATPTQSAETASLKYVMVEINGREFSVEVARTDEEIETGLSNRKELGSDGMLFIIDPPRTPSFWMKGMNFPLDIIWIRNGIVMTVDHNVPILSQTGNPPTYRPPNAVDQVLELPAGTAARFGFKTGSVVSMGYPVTSAP